MPLTLQSLSRMGRNLVELFKKLLHHNLKNLGAQALSNSRLKLHLRRENQTFRKFKTLFPLAYLPKKIHETEKNMHDIFAMNG